MEWPAHLPLVGGGGVSVSVGIHVWHVKCMDMLSIISITIKNKMNK